MTDPDEMHDLALAARDGDRDALNRLLELLYDRVAAVTRRICGPDNDDATQRALIGIARGIRRFDDRASVTTWIYRIATNAALDELRSRKRHGEHADIWSLELASEASAIERVEDRMIIDQALQSLSPDHRAAIVLREIAQLDYEEIARILEVPVGTVRSRINRARGHLASALSPRNYLDASGVQPHEP